MDIFLFVVRKLLLRSMVEATAKLKVPSPVADTEDKGEYNYLKLCCNGVELFINI